SVAARASRYGRTPGYLTKANAEICVLVQVETRIALDNLEAIAKVEGIDGVFIGPSDLAASLGHLGNPQHPEAQAAMQDAVTRLNALGKPAGILTGNEEEARRYIDWGYLFVAVGADVGLLAPSAEPLAKKLKIWPLGRCTAGEGAFLGYLKCSRISLHGRSYPQVC